MLHTSLLPVVVSLWPRVEAIIREEVKGPVGDLRASLELLIEVFSRFAVYVQLRGIPVTAINPELVVQYAVLGMVVFAWGGCGLGRECCCLRCGERIGNLATYKLTYSSKKQPWYNAFNCCETVPA